MKNADPDFIVSFLTAFQLKPNSFFKALIKLNLNGEITEFEGRVCIRLHENHFELELLSKELKHLTGIFDSRVDIFTIRKQGTLNIGGITRNYSYKASIFPLEKQT